MSESGVPAIRRRAAEVGQAVERQHTDAAAVGENRQPLAGKRPQPRERFGGVEQLVEIAHAQQAGAAERGVINCVRPGERPGGAGAERVDLALQIGRFAKEEHGHTAPGVGEHRFKIRSRPLKVSEELERLPTGM